MRRPCAALGPLAAAAFALACEPADAPEPPPPADAVALYEGGSVTRGELDAWILALPAERRVVPAEGRAAWYEARLRERVLHEVLLREARAAGLEGDPEVERLVRAARRRVVADAFLARALGPPRAPSEEELRRLYDARAAGFRRPDLRLLRHWYKRIPAGGEAGAALAALAELRARLAAGESFEALARDHSDSQSRHQGGLLGWVERGSLPRAVAERVFALPVGAPSEPMRLGPGAHVFLVEQAVEERVFSFEEVRPELARQWAADQIESATRELLRAHPLPPGSHVPDAAEAERLLREGGAEDVVLRVGGAELRVGELRAELAERAQLQPDLPASELLRAALRAHERAERIYQSEARPSDAELGLSADAERALREAVLAHVRREREVRRSALAGADLEAFFARQRLRFASPLRLRLRRFLVPLGPSPDATMEGAEAAALGEAAAFEAWARARGASARDEGWSALPALAARDPAAARFAADLAEGELSPPHRVGAEIQVVQVLEREEPAAPAFEAAREAVEQAWLEQHGEKARERWAEATLRRVHYRPQLDRIPELAGAGGPSAPVARTGD